MVRLQVYITAAQHRALRKRARRQRVSMTELLRRIFDDHLEGTRGVEQFPKGAILSFVALGASGGRDVSVRHDATMDEALRRRSVR